MDRTRIQYKGPQPTAKDFEEHRARMQLLRESELEDRAEVDEIARFSRAGQHEAAQALGLQRYNRRKIRFVAQDAALAAERSRRAGVIPSGEGDTASDVSPATARPPLSFREQCQKVREICAQLCAKEASTGGAR